MEFVNLTGADLPISAFSLGAPEIGARQTEAEANQLLDLWVENGGNFLDTARIYSDWIPVEKRRSERILSEWLKSNDLLKNIVLATKGGHPLLETMSRSL